MAENIVAVDAEILPETRCGICGSGVSVKYKNHPGYQEPVCFDIMYCANCDTSFASPMAVDNKIYDLIYSNIRETPGYCRYYGYALAVLDQKEPLKYLSDNEDMYWGINNFLQKFSISKTSRILEVGCGFGYLTYSIFQAGYDITGLDISQEAVDNAAKRYGPHYVCADLNQYAPRNEKQYDVVILTEVIEHVPDIAAFIGSLNLLVKDDGFIVLTTPSKNAYAGEVVWKTELPPIHLWWLSRTSVAKMASLVGREAIFTDFAEYNLLNPVRQHRVLPGVPTKKPVFSSDNRLLWSETPPRKKSLFSRGVKCIKLKLSGKFSVRESDAVERETICAVLVKKT